MSDPVAEPAPEKCAHEWVLIYRGATFDAWRCRVPWCLARKTTEGTGYPLSKLPVRRG